MDKIDRALYERCADIKVLASDLIITSGDFTPEQITKRLMEYKKQNKTYVSLSFCELDGVIIADTNELDIGRKHRKTMCFEKALRGKVYKSGEVCIEKDFAAPTIDFAAPVKDEYGEIFGVVLSSVSIAALHEIIEQACGIDKYPEEIKSIEIDVVNKDGLLLYSNHNKKGILKDIFADYESVKRSIAGEETGILTYYEPFSKEEDVFVFVHEQGYLDFQGNNWTLLLRTPTKEAFASAVQLRNKMMAILSAVILLTIVVSVIFSQTVSKPIVKLKNAAAEIGKGKLDTRIEITAKDEIGKLAQSFNEMVLNLSKVTASRDALNNEIAERRQVEENLYKYQQQLRSLASELSKTEEETRRRIAVELHDNIGHDLTIAKMKAETLYEELANTEYSNTINEIVDTIIKSIKDVSLFTFELSPAILYELGLDAAVEWLVRQFEEQSGIICHFNGDGQDKTLPSDLQVLLFRCIRELLTNVRKHAQAKMVSITAGKDSAGYRVTVEDDGSGFDPSSVTMLKHSSNGGFGLFSVTERLNFQGGSVEIDSEPEKGTRITLKVPLLEEVYA